MVLNSSGSVNSLMLVNDRLTTASIWEAFEIATVQSEGSAPESRDFLNSMLRGTERACADSRRIRGCMSSGPSELFVLRDASLAS